MNCTPFVRQYDILSDKWGDFICQRAYRAIGEKLYLSPILDLCSSNLACYTISDRPVLSMVTAMLDNAFVKIPDNTNLILHSDQGWQHTVPEDAPGEGAPAEHEPEGQLSGRRCD